MVNEIIMTFEQNVEREQYFNFCKINGFNKNKAESLNLYCSLIREVKQCK